MQNTKVIKLLQTFTGTEFKNLGVFISSAYFNREKVLVSFYDQLKRYYPDFKNSKLNKEIFFKFLFPGKKYNDALLRNTNSDFLKLAEKFLKFAHFENEKFYGQYLLLKELTNRKQEPLFKANFKLADKFLDSDSARDEIYYQNKFLLEDEWRRNHVVNSSKMLFETDNLDKQSQRLHVYYITEFIKLYAILLNQSKYTYDYKFDFSLFEVIRDYLEKNFSAYDKIPYIKIFYNCVMLYKTGEVKFYKELNILLKKDYKLLTLTDRKNIFIVLTKFCDEQILKGNFHFYNEKFTIFENFLKTRAFYEGNDFMAHYIYEAIALNAIDCGKTDWALKFLKKYKNIVHSDFRESSYNISMAELLFNMGKNREALEILSLVIPINVKVRTSINILLLKIFFCTNETSSFNSLLESSRKFIIRNKTVQEINKAQFANFLKFINKLYKIRSDKDHIHELKPLSKIILNCKELISKKWLMETAKQLTINN